MRSLNALKNSSQATSSDDSRFSLPDFSDNESQYGSITSACSSTILSNEIQPKFNTPTLERSEILTGQIEVVGQVDAVVHENAKTIPLITAQTNTPTIENISVIPKKAALMTIAVLGREVGSEIEDRLSNYVAFGKVLVPLEDTIIVGDRYCMRSCNPSDYTC